MEPEDWSRLRSWFERCLEADDRERHDVLTALREEDSALHREVQLLLEEDRRGDPHLEPPSLTAHHALPEGGRIGPYVIAREIGRGGMGTVLHARRVGAFERDVAIKLIKRGMDTDEVVRRFETERQVLADLRHPGIAQLFDGGVTESGLPYLVMELIEGTRIDEYCDHRRLDLPARLRLFERVCAAVQHAHENFVVHRDLKPSNVLVTEQGRPVLLDFGIAKLLDSQARITVTGGRPMTLDYASPEQVRGKPITPASDVYALGVLLYRLLCGHSPYATSGPRMAFELERAICDEVPLPASASAARTREHEGAPLHSPDELAANRGTDRRGLRSQLRGDLDTICATALRKTPERRYASPRELADDIRRHLEGQPIAAHPESAAYRTRKYVRRNRVSIAVGLVVCLLLLFSLGASLFGTLQMRGRLRELRLSSDIRAVPYLERVAEHELWPAEPAKLGALRAWLEEAEPLLERLDSDRFDADERTAFGALVDDVRSRARFAETVEQRTVGDHAAAWSATRARVRAHPTYAGLDLAPQTGLIPLGPDPDSQLEEFAHLRSGTPAVRDDTTGTLAITETTGIVLVLLPGGSARIGATPLEDPAARPNESPVHTVRLAPFFLSKYEMTQAQWMLGTGSNPSRFPAGESFGGQRHTLRHPVENVSWNDCAYALPRAGLTLPTEAQWEYGCRAGTATVWWTGDDPASLEGAANLSDSTARVHPGDFPIEDFVAWRDGWSTTSPVGALRANRFGLHDTHGNVWEWVLDAYASYELPAAPGTGLRVGEGRTRVTRGGCFDYVASTSRSALRDEWASNACYGATGVRPARAVR